MTPNVTCNVTWEPFLEHNLTYLISYISSVDPFLEHNLTYLISYISSVPTPNVKCNMRPPLKKFFSQNLFFFRFFFGFFSEPERTVFLRVA